MNMQDFINLSLAISALCNAILFYQLRKTVKVMQILMAVHQRQTLESIGKLNKADKDALDAISKLADIVGKITK